MSKANDTQIGGEHYKGKMQHWDYAASNNLDYFAGCITKYITRWKLKNGIEDLYKARHFLNKYIELEEERIKEELIVEGLEITPLMRSSNDQTELDLGPDKHYVDQD